MAVITSSVDTTEVKLSPLPGITDVALAKEDVLKPAITMSPSGAMIEPDILERVDYAHPAVDNNPRAGQPVIANRIDFNDPAITGAEAVERNLGYAATPAAPAPGVATK